jgi:hypothetical protein
MVTTQHSIVPDTMDVDQMGAYVAVGFRAVSPHVDDGIDEEVVAFLTTGQALDLHRKLLPYTFTPEEMADYEAGA